FLFFSLHPPMNNTFVAGLIRNERNLKRKPIILFFMIVSLSLLLFNFQYLIHWFTPLTIHSKQDLLPYLCDTEDTLFHHIPLNAASTNMLYSASPTEIYGLSTAAPFL